MNIKRLLPFVTLLLVFAVSAASASGLSTDSLTATYVTSPLNIPSIIDKEYRLFESTLGIPVSYAEITSGADQTQALASGDVQLLYAVGGTSVILSAANGADIRVLSMYSRAPRAFCLYSKDESLNSPESLRGKVIAGPAGTNLHELLVAYLATAGMTIGDVSYVSMGIPEARAAMENGSADVALLGGAAAANAAGQGCHLICDGEGLISAIIAVAVTGEYAEAHPDVIQGIRDAHGAILQKMSEDPEAAFALTAENLGLTQDDVRDMAAAYDFSPEITQEDRDGFQKTADFLYAAGMIDAPFDTSSLYLN